MANQSALMECCEAWRQALCIYDVRKLRVTLYQRVALHRSWLMRTRLLATPRSWWHFAIQCCMPSEHELPRLAAPLHVLFVQYFSEFVGNESK